MGVASSSAVGEAIGSMVAVTVAAGSGVAVAVAVGSAVVVGEGVTVMVAVAVAGLFAAELQALGRPEGEMFIPLAFALVFATVILAGFTIGPLAKMLGLAQGGGNGVLIVGANPWSLGLAKALKAMDIDFKFLLSLSLPL